MSQKIESSKAAHAPAAIVLLIAGFCLQGTASAASWTLWSTVSDTTLVNPSWGGPPVDALGAGLGFSTKDVRFYYDDNNKGIRVEIETKMPQTGVDLSVGFADLADIYFDLGGGQIRGVSLVDHEGTKTQGTSTSGIHTDLGPGYYDAPDWWTSQDVWAGLSPRLGAYGFSTSPDGNPINTLMRSNASLVQGVTTDIDWSVDGLLTATLFFGNGVLADYDAFRDGFSFLWGTGNCANDTTLGVVPIPAAFWLFGSVLLGVAGVSRKERR